jgi:hypothetical protein
MNADRPVLDSSYPDGDGYWQDASPDEEFEKTETVVATLRQGEEHMSDDLVCRLRKRAEIRRQIPDRKSVQEGQPDRIADLLEEAADALEESKLKEKNT